ncbi:MAG: hypothetical protein KF760_11870 [Candidatus Eremiobacteraeota bacterium]|nr:hypothetical protein [Candidatus Eremiobacteraeota bacterium]
MRVLRGSLGSSCEGIAVLAVAPLMAAKVIATVRRRGRPKSMTDARDLALLLHFPQLKEHAGPVSRLLADTGEEIRKE